MAIVTVSDTTLTDIANAIREKLSSEDTYKPSEMADAIDSISGGGITPTGTINITENGTHDVTNYASASVAVHQGITPTGTKQISITQNGTTTEDVTNYANAEIAVNVSGGGEYTLEDVVEGNISGAIVYTGTKLRSCQFMGAVPITSFTADSVTAFVNDAVSGERAVFKGNTYLQTISMALFNITSNCQSMFSGCSSLKNVSLPAWTNIQSYTFRDCTSLEKLYLPAATTLGVNCVRGCTSLEVAEFDANVRISGGEAFLNCSSMNKLILRANSISILDTINNFKGTPFASDGTGGTLYVPSSLIASYQSASNWSTILGYTNNTITSIEGSVYANYHIDDTPVS